MAGKLYLVGAGPGDPGLITVKGRRCLQQADVVIYDYLANPALLEHAPATAEKILVGKHGGGARVEQDVINALLLDRAGLGKIVVRLKGGDPFIFGRGGEEAEAAARAGIDFEIVPGVTSAVAVPAYAGIPLTHRDLASNVIFTTGYEYPNKPELTVRWHELARSGSTLVILMTQRQLRGNMNKLVESGLAASTPAAVIEWGTRASQRTIIGEVGTIADLAEQAKVKPPSLAIVGDVVRLHERLQWFERKPLFGRRIVVTRPRQQSAALAQRLEELGAEVVVFPSIEIVPPESYVPVDAALTRAGDFDWVVLTSANGVHAFFQRLQHLHIDVRSWHRAQFAAIGPQTAALIEAHGIHVAALPGEYRAEGLLAALAEMGVKGKRVLLPRAAGARPVLPDQLRALGADVEEVHTYRSIPARQDVAQLKALLAEDAIDVITFTSSSTVHNFVAAFDGDIAAHLGHAAIACIGPITSATARDYGMHPSIEPTAYTITALSNAILERLAAC